MVLRHPHLFIMARAEHVTQKGADGLILLLLCRTFADMTTMSTLLIFAAAIILMVVAIARWKVHPFLAILGTALLLAVLLGIPFAADRQCAGAHGWRCGTGSGRGARGGQAASPVGDDAHRMDCVDTGVL